MSADDLEAVESAVDLKRVVGLKYDRGMGLPEVILKAAGPLAEEVLRQRRPRTGPQVVKNEALLRALYRLPVDAAIGPELFRAVAAILAHVLALEARRKEMRDA